MRHPDLSKIRVLLESGKEVRITREKYISLAGIDLPQSKSYTEKSSALARLAHSLGFDVKVIPEVICFIPINSTSKE